MNKFFTLLFLFFLLSLTANTQSYHDGKIIFKIKREFTDKIQEANNNYIQELNLILRNHKISKLLSEQIIKGLNNKSNNNEKLLSIKNYGLERIFLIDIDKNYNPVFISRKLQTFSFIEYAEPLYKREISDLIIPNDSLFFTQYVFKSASILESWKNVDTTNRKVVIGIVDTGVDYLHEDLKDNIYHNPGEMGLDNQGNDRSQNGIDDDDNGFVDDWRGWDFGSSSFETGMDNDPYPGNGHGTHVAGIIGATANNEIGIAGIGLNTKILPVKIGQDDPNSRGLIKSYEGLLYAAIAGSDIINCSWGGGGFSQSEQDIINTALELGSVVVAAAGNNYSNEAFFPASYKGVLSVAAIDSMDFKAGFSNYHSTVGISAPGVNIMSSTPANNYDSWSGTSMASPVVAAVAGMVKLNHPEYISIQVNEHLKATSDNIAIRNPNFSGMIGSGKVNANAATTVKEPVSLLLSNYKISKETDDDVIRSGDKVYLEIEIFNALKNADKVNIYAESLTQFAPEFVVDSLYAGDINTLELKQVNGRFEFILQDNMPLNFNLPIRLNIIDNEQNRFIFSISIFVNPTWRTMKSNNIQVTFNSQGNIGYDDFPSNNRGSGFKYLSSSNILFEGALMTGFSYNRISNVARGSSGSAANRDFAILEPIIQEIPGQIAAEQTYSAFNSKEDTSIAKVKIVHNAYQFVEEELDDVVIVNYDLINESGEFQDSVFTALYFDWDIGPGGSNNQASWDSKNQFAKFVNAKSEEYPKVGIKLLSNQAINFFAIDNDGDSEENPGVYDGFTKEEKWKMMTSGIGRQISGITDASMVFGAGPVSMRPNDTVRVSFAIFAEYDSTKLEKTAIDLKKNITGKINPNGNFSSQTEFAYMTLVFPNPADDILTVEMIVPEINYLKLTLWDLNGKKIKELYEYDSSSIHKIYPGVNRLLIDLNPFSQGQYVISMESDKGNTSKILNIVR